MRHALILLILVASIALLALSAQAQWQANGVPVSTAAGDQQSSKSVSDGGGGTLAAWHDYRGGATADIYAQWVDADGFPGWTPDGIALCSAANDQLTPVIATDLAGGAIVAWDDYRDGATADIYVQRVDDTGTPLWTGNGVALCTAADDQISAAIVYDNAGGAIVAWQDRRSGTTYDIYVQRINASGAPQWTPGGVAVCTAANNQTAPKIALSGVGGAIITWEDARNGSSFNIYAQRLSDSGAPLWTADGVVLCTIGSIQPAIVQDGTGGAVVTFYRSPADIYVQRISTSGVPLWTTDGVPLCTATGIQTFPTIITASVGGAVVTWQDQRNGTHYDIFAQRVNGSGVIQWATDGVALCTAANDQYFPTMVRDGAGGAIVTWSDVRSGSLSDIYTQRVDNLGVPLWTPNGVALTSAGDGIFPTIVSDDAEGAIVTWNDYRSGGANIYAQHVDASGEIPIVVSAPTLGPSSLVSGIYPNPFTSTATLAIELTTPSAVLIEVFDVAGRMLRTMSLQDAVGSQRIHFDGRNDRGRLLPSGVYLYRVSTEGTTVTRKMVIAR
jgi:hypothetical protein